MTAADLPSPTAAAAAPEVAAAGPWPSASAPSVQDALELLGLAAYTELVGFGRLAGDAAQAPTLRARQTLSTAAGTLLARQERLLGRVAELGGDPEACMAAFDGAYVDFDARTDPGTWWEALLKNYVGQGVADDFCLLVAEGLDARSRTVVVDAVARDAAEGLSALIAEAAAADPVLASRLALWGRRLVGEALGVVGAVLAQRPAICRLVAVAARADGSGTAAPRDDDGAGTQSWVFARLTAEHTRRMGRLGLAA